MALTYIAYPKNEWASTDEERRQMQAEIAASARIVASS